MYELLKLSPHEHRGKIRPHEHTSYLPLVFLVFIVGLTLTFLSVSVYADHPPPQAGSVGLTGSVPAEPPKTGATINSPKDGQHFATSPITVSGSCPSDTIVEIFKNNIFAGSTPCLSSGSFSIEIDLLFGKNDLTAQVYDVLNQAGPLSKTVTVFYDAKLPQAAPSAFINFTGTQLLLNTDGIYRGIFPNQQLNVPITIIGGSPPFAVNIQWGDSTNQLISRAENSTFNATHVYKKPGTYKITIQATDANQLVAFLTVAAIVNGNPETLSVPSTPTSATLNKLFVLWPVLAIAIAMVGSFWFGEHREKKILSSKAKPQNPFGANSDSTT